MTHQEATDLLNVADNATTAEIQVKYREARDQLQQVLNATSAPNLKKIYQSNLQDLEQAYDLLQSRSAEKPVASTAPEGQVARPHPLATYSVVPALMAGLMALQYRLPAESDPYRMDFAPPLMICNLCLVGIAMSVLSLSQVLRNRANWKWPIWGFISLGISGYLLFNYLRYIIPDLLDLMKSITNG